MANKPLLIFPRPTNFDKSRRHGFPSKFHFPSKETQLERLDEKISELERVLENKTAFLQQNAQNFISEMILVLEIAGQVDDFFRAVEKTPGMEFLAEFQDEIDSDDNFHSLDNEGNRSEKAINTRLFLTMTNQRALQELLGYWNEYKKDKAEQKFKRNTTKFRTVFEQLKDLRPYSVQDRIQDTGILAYFAEMREYNKDRVKFEIELVYKENEELRNQSYQEVVSLLNFNEGQAIVDSRIILPEINYHAFIAEAPLNAFDDLSENTNISFLKSQQILFFRPVGQSIYKKGEQAELPLVEGYEEVNETIGQPVAALLDGLPLENHVTLRGRLQIDDPDDYTANYIAANRMHGTIMSSLILNGDINNPNEKQVMRPLYVRPIMKPYGLGLESLPDDILPIDLIHRSVKRMFEGDGDTPPTAPNVKIINFSIGDPFRPFHLNISAWAKLLDWLSYKYDVLFIVSAGNFVEDYILDINRDDFENTPVETIQLETIKQIVHHNTGRKILTPAESINSITVGCSHGDSSIIPANHFARKNLVTDKDLISPISRVGFGYKKSIKPDILMPGGRKLFRLPPIPHQDRNKTQLYLEDGVSFDFPPGNKVAYPGNNGETNRVGFMSGTSNSAALTTKLAIELYELIENLNSEDGNNIDPKFYTVIIKSLLVHGASWKNAKDKIQSIVQNIPGVARNTVKRNIYPYVGYGTVDTARVLYCTDQRVTLIGYGEIGRDNAHVYRFPLPPSIGQRIMDKRLTISLAWISPLNFKTYKYRKAHLFFDNVKNNGHLSLGREESDFDTAQRGTVQHDILFGNKADAFVDGDFINIKVSCREDASGLSSTEVIKYGLAVTLEIPENIDTQIYQEIEQRIRPRIRPRA